MFDTESEKKQIQIKYNAARAGMEGKKFKQHIIIVAAISGVLVVILSILFILFAYRDGFSSPDDSTMSEPDTGVLGLQNPNKLTDIKTTTAEDMQAEYESRPAVTENNVATFERAIENYLSCGDFESLDSYLRDQSEIYKGPEGEEAEYVEDWGTKFPMLRSDTQNAMNLVNKVVEPSASRYTIFSSPDILAAAVAWSPITMKINAFLDYSALILPPPSKGDNLDMVEYNYSSNRASEMMLEISSETGETITGIAAYDMTVSGYRIRVILVAGSTGHWRPWSVMDLSGTLPHENWTKTFLKNNIEPSISYRTTLDDVCYLSPSDTQVDKDAHPEWFDEDGVYIGPEVKVQTSESETLPIEEEPAEPSAEESPETPVETAQIDMKSATVENQPTTDVSATPQ